MARVAADVSDAPEAELAGRTDLRKGADGTTRYMQDCIGSGDAVAPDCQCRRWADPKGCDRSRAVAWVDTVRDVQALRICAGPATRSVASMQGTEIGDGLQCAALKVENPECTHMAVVHMAVAAQKLHCRVECAAPGPSAHSAVKTDPPAQSAGRVDSVCVGVSVPAAGSHVYTVTAEPFSSFTYTAFPKPSEVVQWTR